jgi:hypothetical protein
MIDILIKLVNAEQIGGWVRAAVAAFFGANAGLFVGPLVGFADPAAQTAAGVVLATLAVGVWSTVAKKVSG